MALLIATIVFLGFMLGLGYVTLARRKPVAFGICMAASIAVFVWSIHYGIQLRGPRTPDQDWHLLYMQIIWFSMPVVWIALAYLGVRKHRKDYMARYGELADRG